MRKWCQKIKEPSHVENVEIFKLINPFMDRWVGILFILLFLPISVQSQSYQRPVNFYDFVIGIEADEDGVVFAGYSNTQDIYYEEAWIAKVDFNGNVLWSNHYGNHESYIITSFSKSIDDEFLLAGYSNSMGIFIPFVIKVDDHGELIWKKEYQNLENHTIIEVASMINGDVMMIFNPVPFHQRLVGFTRPDGMLRWLGNLTDEYEIGHEILETNENNETAVVGGSEHLFQNALLTQVNGTGQVQWRSTFGNNAPTYEVVRYVSAIDFHNETIYASGKTWNPQLGEQVDYWVWKLDNSGQTLGNMTYPTTTRLEVQDIIVVKNGDYIILINEDASVGLSGSINYFNQDGIQIWSKEMNLEDQYAQVMGAVETKSEDIFIVSQLTIQDVGMEILLSKIFSNGGYAEFIFEGSAFIYTPTPSRIESNRWFISYPTFWILPILVILFFKKIIDVQKKKIQ